MEKKNQNKTDLEMTRMKDRKFLYEKAAKSRKRGQSRAKFKEYVYHVYPNTVENIGGRRVFEHFLAMFWTEEDEEEEIGNATAGGGNEEKESSKD